ncbi:hypothetical protein ASPZODRAFT_110293 [Penicilliopsis zonata CBS 506.65]|uniref:Uncharacterized protein n=1 Tax=Penicilliopsis zonata CBS 506.65 TaxID=1073090 RepID=A0A1L9SST4_9EURO|nr:hypothetical protein ASPZODRAFT_110293 [Penicilliopsis zonata CBS 506.65]OJJ50161.1 hypothetical protein ASPZODRAFT_110293 [Penicilliopsis zonata CBS 506.65]
MALPGLRSAVLPGRVVASRAFSVSSACRNVATSLPARKPVGAFRGGVFGFLAGSVAAGISVYYYILAEYRVSNEMLTEDIYALQVATRKLQTYITELETKVDQLQKKN